MMIDDILPFVVLALIIASAYFVSRRIYKTFTARGNKYTLAISIAGFVLSFTLIATAVVVLIAYNTRFER